VFVWDRVRTFRSNGRLAPRLPWRAAAGCIALYLVVMAPWYLRQLSVFGSISPTSSSGFALWIRTIEEWNSITVRPSLSSFLAQGIGPIVTSRVLGLVAAIGQFAVIICSVVLLPFVIAGGWLRRHSIDFGPWFLYTALVFLGAMLLYPLHVPGGAFIHSAVGLESHAYILALEGVVAGVAWIARRRPRWNADNASRVFVGTAVAFTVATAFLYAVPVARNWDLSRQPRLALAAQLDRLGVGANDRLLTIDAAGFKYFTGRGGVVTPDDPIDSIESVARAYGTRWLVLERDDLARALVPVLRGESRPPWIGPQVFGVPSSDGGPPRLAFYPVCASAADTRCGPTTSASRS
jgi:hypothetical protein